MWDHFTPPGPQNAAPFFFPRTLYNMYVYILYSEKLDRFYVGQTALSPKQRLEEHNNAHNENSFTSRGIPWTLFLTIACDSREHAKGVERHIKRMKSKAYQYSPAAFSTELYRSCFT